MVLDTSLGTLNCSSAVLVLVFAPHFVLWVGLCLVSFLWLYLTIASVFSFGELSLCNYSLAYQVVSSLPAIERPLADNQWRVSAFFGTVSAQLFLPLQILHCETSSLTRSFQERLWFLCSADIVDTRNCYSGFLLRSLWWRPKIMRTKPVNRTGNNAYHHSSPLPLSCITGCFHSIQQQKAGQYRKTE